MTDAAAVRRALVGCAGVHVSVSGHAELPAVLNAAAAASELNLARISYVSGTATFQKNSRFPLMRTKLQCEAVLARCGVQHTVFCPAFAMEVLPMHIRNGNASYFGRQPHPFHWIAAGDLGRMVAEAYTTPETAGRRLFLWGPEANSIRETLLRYCATRHPGARKPSSLPFWLARFIAATSRNGAMKSALEAYEMFQGVGGDGGDPTEANRLPPGRTRPLVQVVDSTALES